MLMGLFCVDTGMGFFVQDTKGTLLCHSTRTCFTHTPTHAFKEGEAEGEADGI